MGTLEQMPEQVVNVQGAASIGLATVSWLADLEFWLQIGATGAALLVGITAALWNFEKWRAARRERKRAEHREKYPAEVDARKDKTR